jgi:hypothetical protein
MTMWKTVLAGTAALAIVGSSIVYAQQRFGGDEHHRWQFSQEDRAAFAAARIAALKAGLALNAEQEKQWPAFEAAVKDLSRYRQEQRVARRDAKPSNDPTERLRRRADMLSGYGTALKKLADAQEPLYNGLDDAQKRRFAVLAHMLRPGYGGHHWHHMRHHGGPGAGRPGDDHGSRDGMERRGEGGPGMRGDARRHHLDRAFQDWRDHRFGRNDSSDGAPRHALPPATNGEGEDL